MTGFSITSTSRNWPPGSIARKSPARSFRGSPPDMGKDQTTPPAATYSTCPSSEETSAEMGPLSKGMRRVILPLEVAAMAMVRPGRVSFRRPFQQEVYHAYAVRAQPRPVSLNPPGTIRTMPLISEPSRRKKNC